MIVKYSKKFTTGPWLNEDIGFETDINGLHGTPNEQEVLECLAYLKSIAEKFHKDNNPQLVEGWKSGENYVTGVVPYDSVKDVPFTYTQQPIPTKDISEDRVSDKDVEFMVTAISQCRSKHEVESYKWVAQKDETVRQAYLEKLKQFV